MDENSNTTSITDELNNLRSILRSDDHLQIQPSGDYEQVRIRLDHDIQISFFFDSLRILNKSLTINDIHDLRINKPSNKSPLNNDQWTNIKEHFNEIIQQSNNNTSLQSIIQLMQDHLLKISIKNSKYKPKEKKSTSIASKEDTTTTTNKFRGADLIFNRILHDRTIDRSQVIIGYEDRFTGLHEIQFNEFKKVHDHEYGVPMHRIRHFKINGRTVWDRTQKIDTLTGSEQENGTLNDMGQHLPRVQGLYYFDQSGQQWIEWPHMSLMDDDPKIPSTTETCLPEQCHFVTWNILFDYHHSTLIYTPQRYQSILNTLKTLLPDVICLQEVTKNFLDLLLNEIWLQQNNYYIIIMQSIINSEQDKSFGQLLLTKNFRPRSFSICPLETSADASATATAAATTTKKATKELIIARFGLNSTITIDLVNIHLHSNRSRNANEKRCRALENLFKNMNTNNYMFIGDFNFGDYDLKEQDLLDKYKHDVHDLWKNIYDVEQNSGFTFDPSRNICAKITSDSQINRRLDRYLIHTLQNLNYSIEHLNMVGIETVSIDPLDNNKQINQSDHYALQLIINFQTRSISHRSALVILPTTDKWSLIEPYREQYDPSFNRWPPHFNLLWPFFDLTDCENDQENILLPLRLLLSQYQTFNAQVNEIDTFIENNITFMKLNHQSTEYVKQLHEQIKKLFPQCSINNRNSYNPHMTIAQFDNEEKRNQAKSALTLSEPFEFPVQYVYILQRPHDNDTTPFHISYQLPLGPVLEPLSSKQINSVDRKLQEFFEKLNLYENEQSYKQKHDKYQRLSSCFEQIFNKETLHCFNYNFLPYGSYRIGINGEDLDTVFYLNEIKTKTNETTFDETLLRLKNDSNALNNYIVNLLEGQINENFKDEIIDYRNIEALFPIISILFNDQTKVEIFVQIKTNDLNSEESIHGIHDIERLLTYVRCPPIFQHLLTFIRRWAQNVGLYGQVYGYLGGYSWAILCGYICHSYLSSIKDLSSIEYFSIEEFFSLVYKFFSTYSQFNWSSQSLYLYTKTYKQLTQTEKSSVHNRGSMRILSPSSPYYNTGRSTINSTRDLIIQGFQNVLELLNKINTINDEDKLNALEQILKLNKNFPNENIKSIIQFTLSTENNNQLNQWIGWMKSRLAHFINDCEQECHLIIQTDNFIQYKLNNNEALYSIGFQLDEQKLNQHRNFYYCLNKFIDQFNLCPNRTETMKISYKIISIHDWKLERMQPKQQRIRK